MQLQHPNQQSNELIKSKDDDALNSDEENYLQMVVFQATSSVGPGRHVCNLCHKEFKHARWLKLHMRSHSNWIKANCKKPPMCPICERTFKVREAFILLLLKSNSKLKNQI